jgi:sugar phosphate isomerase/epimerase
MRQTLHPANRLAFATSLADWSWERMLELARAFGYGGIEITAGAPTQWSQHPFLKNPAATAHAAADAGIAISMLATTLTLNAGTADVQHFGAQAIELAAILNTPAIRILGYRIARGSHKSEWLAHAAENWRWLCNRAAASNVQIALQNGGDLNSPTDLWSLAEMVQHPLAKICWDIAASHAHGDAPSVGISTLNSRITCVHAADYNRQNDARQNDLWTPAAMGTGEIPLEAALDRLSGIGYAGPVTLAPSALKLASLPPNVASLPNEAELAHAGTQLRQWLNLPALALDQTPEDPQSTEPTQPTGAA